MKKVALAATIALSVSNFSFAETYEVSSNITDVKHVLDTSVGYLETGGAASANAVVYSGAFDIEVTGDTYTINSGTLSMDGSTVAFTAAGAYVELAYSGVEGLVDGAAGRVNMTTGLLNVVAEGAPYDVVDIGTENINYTDAQYCIASSVFGCSAFTTLSGIDLLGGTVNADGSITLNLSGIPPVFGAGGLADIDQATTTMEVFGFTALQYQEGTITLRPMVALPVPAAAWLFGSGLIGLFGMKRLRNKK